MESRQPSEANQAWESLVSLKEKYEEGTKMQEEWQEKVDDVNFIVTYTSENNKVNKDHMKELEEYRNLKNIDLTDCLKGTVYDTIKINHCCLIRLTLISGGSVLLAF